MSGVWEGRMSPKKSPEVRLLKYAKQEKDLFVFSSSSSGYGYGRWGRLRQRHGRAPAGRLPSLGLPLLAPRSHVGALTDSLLSLVWVLSGRMEGNA